MRTWGLCCVATSSLGWQAPRLVCSSWVQLDHRLARPARDHTCSLNYSLTAHCVHAICWKDFQVTDANSDGYLC